eukprot:CAMPEP_0119320208 /NCGR_PEP_ID=MMETSP1333-20130426/51846_1 /TAXON_ID=418940 /ORGANISM="Scyphosphaera apsteinii, Strain RCC1455" /LENGTH=212 /DNA_ID=CAMNT_0007326875 /DNA_START=287 /DNA_END=925 /DNA_ORIENTATION=+
MSQTKEEQTLVSRFYSSHRGGTFVEIGGYDGLTYSNTYYLERCAGWHGLLIEANPVNFAQLLSNVLRFRPGTKAVHSAVCAPPRRTVPFTTLGGVSATDTRLAGSEFFEDRRTGWVGRDRTTVDVPCTTFAHLIANLSIIDLLSIDVEGGEWEVVSTAGLQDATRVGTLLIEFDGRNAAKEHNITQYLQAIGYQLCKTVRLYRSVVFRRHCG